MTNYRITEVQVEAGNNECAAEEEIVCAECGRAAGWRTDGLGLAGDPLSCEYCSAPQPK